MEARGAFASKVLGDFASVNRCVTVQKTVKFLDCFFESLTDGEDRDDDVLHVQLLKVAITEGATI